MPEGLITTYSKARKVSKALTEFHRTGKTKEEREIGHVDDARDGFLSLYVLSSDTDYKVSLPLKGSVVPEVKRVTNSDILYKLLHKSPTRLFYFDVSVGKTILGEVYGVEIAKTQLAGAGVTDDDASAVLGAMSDESIPSYFNMPLLTDIISSAGFVGFVYSSPFDRSAFVIWDGLDDLMVSGYSLDGGSTWADTN